MVRITIQFTKLTESKRAKRLVPRQTRKTTQNHAMEVAKNYVETYSPSNAVAPGPEVRALLPKNSKSLQIRGEKYAFKQQE